MHLQHALGHTLASALLFALAGCASVAPTPVASAGVLAEVPAAAGAGQVQADARTQTPPSNDSLNATVWFQTSVERDLVFGEVYRAAGARLREALADKSWDALANADRDNNPRALPPAIIVDIDETVLDNSPGIVRQIRNGAGFDDVTWGRWVEQRAAKPLPGALAFLQAAVKKGVAVYYVSNRDLPQHDATVDNLRNAGFPVASGDQVLLLGMQVAGCEARGTDKACRRRLVGRTHRVLMVFGDQLGDFVSLAPNTPDARRAAMTPYADWIGQRWWVLPNPLYGSWESALVGDAKDDAGKRAAKQAALDDATP